MTPLREDGFLGGRLRIAQPAQGYRAGADAVMLAAACPARADDSVLELGCGAGVASLCIGARVPGARLTGIERQVDYAVLAERNAVANGIALRVLTGDLAVMPGELRGASFDHVIANPPFFAAGTRAPDVGRADARHEDTPLHLWIDAGLRRLRPGGRLVLVLRADRLADVLAVVAGRAGDLSILPLSARVGRDAGRVIIGMRKGARGPLRLRAPLILHAAAVHLEDGEDLTDMAAAILRDGAEINLW
ncbi:MAG: methyltransferase [Paracoccus sp. (in: a-proteobacteria)]|uniref:tRNA1(Val) (adenine(37)-N6)-methyltransferase n=1 Tax=Paracoccus sp. TaxID=267 RepID=UPI0026DFC005|nr:methyltransferase [Paracoccus sp. (in: a-proteobacteria)]MDO5633001.1 methyltransferase [Paracoccus sp. (in: a-proteobacteria)]